MDQYHKPQTKKVRRGTGGSRGKYSDKRLAQIGGVFTATRVAKEDQREKQRVRGGTSRIRLKRAAFASVRTKEGKMVKTRILGVVGGPNPEYVRGNIIVKGTLLNTEAGKVKVTNRVGQDGVVNAVAV